MKLIRKGHGHAHRGVIGIEAAIVMVAFVIVAAALAFVVLNMGFSSTQKAKTTIISGLGEASSSLEVIGKVTGIACTTTASGCGSTSYLNATAVPLRITSGGSSINLDPSVTAIKLITNSVEHSSIYVGTVNTTTATSIEDGFDKAGAAGYISTTMNPVDKIVPSNTIGFIYWTNTNSPQNSFLDPGEHAVLAIGFAASERPLSLDKIRIEIILSTGATLTIERDIPTLTNIVTDLG